MLCDPTRSRRALAALATIAALAACGPTPRPQASTAAPGPGPASPDRLAGQLVMTGMTGTQPDADLLRRVREGQVGGIVLYARNVSAGLPGALETLQQAALAGGNPPLLISVDQEGGPVRRLPGPPASPRAFANAQDAMRQGQATGALLKAFHVNLDLAPIADVSRSPAGFEVAQGRGFAGDPEQVAALADAFVQGVQDDGVAATVKHFPGIGSLTRDTDAHLGQVGLSRAELSRDLLPFRQAVDDGVDVVLVANAVYSALDPTAPATFSAAIIQRLLRGQLGFRGVVMTDALDKPPDLGGDAGSRAVTAVRSGADMVIYAPPADGPAAFTALLAAARAGSLPASRLREAHDHVVALKRRVVR